MHDKKYRNEQKYRKSFKKALSLYCDGRLEQSSVLLNELINRRIDDRTRNKIKKVLLLLLLGELYGINTLQNLLDSYKISSNNYQKIWSKLSCNYLVGLMNEWLWKLFSTEFEKRLSQSASTHSRQKLTLVLDGSIFKQWLQNEEFGKYFGKYYSGQYGCAVYGFNVILCGMVIGEVFYPLHFRLRKKTEKDTEVALQVLSKVYQKLSKIARSKDQSLPTLYFSVDSGFRSKALLNYCDANKLIYIGVPEVTHKVCVKGKWQKIGHLKEEFKQKEAAHYSQNSNSDEPYTWRVRATLNCLNRAVTLLLFRLNGSRKVSVIFSNDFNIKAMTLRRHWFERTKIELLFRLIKHNFKIQQSTVRNRLGFMKKLSFAFVKSVYAQYFTQIVKKTDPKLKRLGFEGIRKQLIFHQIGRHTLDNLMMHDDLLHNDFKITDLFTVI
ncbi:MAG: hypothetical protein AAGG68_24360 [Bacteroidota bacterium]